VVCIVEKEYAVILVVRKAHAVTDIVRTPPAVTLIVWKKYTLTLVVWKKYALTLCVWKACALTLADRKGTSSGMFRLHTTCLTLVDTKEMRRFDKFRLEGYCGANLLLVCIRMASTYWERHVHWQAESRSICGGIRR